MIKLLLADDSVTIQRVVELTFSGEDVQVVAVGDGEQAISRLPTERPDIVLADIGMPKRNGYDVAAFVKSTPDFAHIPVVLLAGAFEPVDDARAKEVKSDGVIVKPFEPQQLIARVHELVDNRKSTTVAEERRDGARVEREPSPPARAEQPAAPVVVPPQPPPTVAVAATPEPARQPTEPVQEGSLDEYFDRLDAAFASLGPTPPGDTAARSPIEEAFGERGVPTVDRILEDTPVRMPPAGPGFDFGRVTPPAVEPPDASPTLTSATPVATTATSTGTAPQTALVVNTGQAIADLFRVLFAAEQGTGEGHLRLQPSPTTVSDELVDEVTRRVLERIAPDAARQVVADIVSQVAERLVREEIQRVKNKQ